MASIKTMQCGAMSLHRMRIQVDRQTERERESVLRVSCSGQSPLTTDHYGLNSAGSRNFERLNMKNLDTYNIYTTLLNIRHLPPETKEENVAFIS